MAILKIPVSKAKGEFIEVDTDKLPEGMYLEAVYQGLKQMAGRNMSKVSKAQYPDAKELAAKAVEVAQANVKAMLENDTKRIKPTSAPKAAKVTGKVNTEAMRLARNMVKDLIKESGGKISHYKPSEITEAAKSILSNPDQGPGIIAQAEKNLSEREAITPKGIDIKALVKESPELVAKAEAKKAAAKKDAPLSAKQAGKVQKRQPPSKPAEATPLQ